MICIKKILSLSPTPNKPLQTVQREKERIESTEDVYTP